MTWTFASCFSGIGGPDLGFERAGFRVIRHCERYTFKSRVLKRHWPDAEHFTDVSLLADRAIRQKQQGQRAVGKRHKQNSGNAEYASLIRADVEWGSPPCQDLSIAGRRKGLAGNRSGLFFAWWEYIEANQPREFAVMEQVPGLFSSNDGKDFAAVLGAFTGWEPPVPREGWRDSGFCRGPKRSVAWRVFDSRYFGLAQRRRRIFFVIGFGERCPSEVLFEPQSLHGNFTPVGKAGHSVSGTITRRSSDSGLDPTCQQFVVGTIPASGAGTDRPAGQGNEADFCIVAPTIRSGRSRPDSGGDPSMGVIAPPEGSLRRRSLRSKGFRRIGPTCRYKNLPRSRGRRERERGVLDSEANNEQGAPMQIDAEMVERAAKAMIKSYCPLSWPTAWDGSSKSTRNGWRRSARAVLRAALSAKERK